MARLPNLVIAGVNKAGTTSLFAQLARHPDVATSDVKETGFFLSIRYGEPLPPRSEYERHFSLAGSRPVVLEATPGYLYGGAPLAAALDDTCPGVRVVVVLREPVARLRSFHRFQQSMLLLPADLGIDEYVTACLERDADALRRRDQNPWFGVEGGRYGGYLDPWVERFGSRLRVVFFDDLAAQPDDVAAAVLGWVGLDPGSVPAATGVENRTVQPRVRALHAAALGANRRFERVLREHPDAKRRLRAVYHRFNAARGGSPEPMASRTVERLAGLYAPSNRAVRSLLQAQVTQLPSWLRDA